MKANINKLKPMQIIVADDGFTCMKAGPKVVRADDGGLFVECGHGHHYLEGQVETNRGTVIGFTLP